MVIVVFVVVVAVVVIVIVDGTKNHPWTSVQVGPAGLMRTMLGSAAESCAG